MVNEIEVKMLTMHRWERLKLAILMGVGPPE